MRTKPPKGEPHRKTQLKLEKNPDELKGKLEKGLIGPLFLIVAERGVSEASEEINSLASSLRTPEPLARAGWSPNETPNIKSP